jgi:hypothetical protein
MPSKTTKRTSAQTSKKAKAVTEVKRPQRKASFEVKMVKGKREFTAVNKRAHKLARIMGKRTKLTVTELKTALQKRPNIHAYAYDGGVLKAVKF